MSEKWIDVSDVDDIPKGDVTAVKVDGKELALYEVEGNIYATDNLCTHGAARMSDGFLDGSEIECPLHQGKFDVCTGKALCAPLTENIRVYPVKIENNRIFLNVA
ncbi:MAG: naphthalene 1,2-dioxygenase system ferredoxin subunit [Pseudomonadota bacterium]|jgi:naphthalene 1,2-dioxygenase ferredoxin component